MNYETVIASAVHNCPLARDFQRLFPNADHAIVQGKRQSDLAGWKSVTEWISRAHLHDRYVAWLVVAIEISPDQIVSQLEEPELYVIEVRKSQEVEMTRVGRSGRLPAYSLRKATGPNSLRAEEILRRWSLK